MKPKKNIFSYQARIHADSHAIAALDAYAGLYGKIERKLYAESFSAGKNPAAFKNDYLKRFGISARMFNALRIGLEGKVSSIIERREGLISEAESRIKKAEATIAKLIKKSADTNKIHQKKRRLHILNTKLKSMVADHEAKRTRIAFGSKRLFNAQHNLAANGYENHAEWLNDWRLARSGEICVVGSGDETAGCQLCVARIDGVNSLSLRIRLPDCLGCYGKYIVVNNVAFHYGFENIAASLQNNTALTYRFKRDEKGWIVFVSTDVKAPEMVSREHVGAIGVDFNADHLAVAVANRHGNLVAYRRVDSQTVGKTTHQRAAILGDAVKSIVALAVDKAMPIVIEKLDFAKKKAELETIDAKRSRIISALAYRQFQSMLKAAAFRAGIKIIEVNPAYTSTIGAVNYAVRYGVSVHIAAAFAIARRGLRLSEKPVAGYKAYYDDSQKIAVAPAGNGGHVTLQIPERKFGKHVWSQWQAIRKNLIAAHKEHFRSGRHKTRPARLASAMKLIGAIRISGAELAGVSHLHCSDGDYLSDVPI